MQLFFFYFLLFDNRRTINLEVMTAFLNSTIFWNYSIFGIFCLFFKVLNFNIFYRGFSQKYDALSKLININL